MWRRDRPSHEALAARQVRHGGHRGAEPEIDTGRPEVRWARERSHDLCLLRVAGVRERERGSEGATLVSAAY